VDLDQPDTTIALLKADAVVGVKAFLEGDRVKSMGITCALCHSTVDDSFTTGVGRHLDGWPNRDLNVGAIVAFAPTVKPIADALGVSEDTVRTVLRSWGPGKYDAELDKDGKAFQPDGRSLGGDRLTGGIRSGRSEHAHLQGLGQRAVLKRVCGGDEDARPGHVHRFTSR
jgi:hypothetical protein